MKMNLTCAIEILKLHKHTTDKFKHSVGDQYVSDAIDTVVEHCEQKTYTAEDMNDFAEWSYKQSYRKMWNAGKYIGYSGMLELWEQQRNEATEL